MSRPTPPVYKTRNWPAYNEALKRRGSLMIWFDPEMSWEAAPTGRRGRQQTFSDAAIQTCLSMKVLFGMALRQTTGFVESLLRLAGLDWTVPNFSTLSRRQKTLAVNIPYRGSNRPLHLLIDSTGIKVEGEAEWHARKHGGPERRIWRKIHLGIDEETLDVRAVEIIGSHIGDAPVLADLLRQIPENEKIGSVTADGATTRASATMRLQTAVPMRSDTLSNLWRSCPHSRPAGTRSPGRPSPPGPWRAMKPCGRPGISAALFGDDGADTTAGAASRRRCIVSNCWASGSRQRTSTARSPNSRSASPS